MNIKMSDLFSASNVFSLCLAFIAVGVAYGATSQRLDDLEKRQDILETRQTALLEQIREDVASLRVEMAKVSQDVSWLKEKETQE
tara:strand:- start:3246 stop:3500 length:255 start_codon:yes stop_codon:yes gene_type:complete